jgi:hypothetical protein
VEAAEGRVGAAEVRAVGVEAGGPHLLEQEQWQPQRQRTQISIPSSPWLWRRCLEKAGKGLRL